MNFWTKSLMSRLVVYFLVLLLITVFSVGAIAFQIARTSIQQLVFERLEVTATLKEEALNLWVENQKNATVSLAELPEIRTQAEILLTQDPSTFEFAEAYTQMQKYMASALAARPDLQEVFILTRVGGKIVFSTDKSREGQYRVKDKYFTEGQTQTFIQNVYPSSVTNRPTMTISTPLRRYQGETIGVLAAHLNLNKMDEIIFDRTGLGRSGETYLVDQYRVFISGEQFGRENFPRGVRTQGIDAALLGKDGEGIYRNYEGIPVIGVYRWLDARELALLVEMHESEAFAPARKLAWAILGIGFVCAGLLAMGVYWFARQIAQPILEITNAATLVADGDLTQVAPVLTDDEVGRLAGAFNRMTRQLRRLYAGLEEKVGQLQAAETELKNSFQQLQWEKQTVEAQRSQLASANQEITILNQRLQSKNLNLMAELQLQNQQLRQFLEAIPLGIVVIDIHEKLYYTNHAAQLLLGSGIMPDPLHPTLEVYPRYLMGTQTPYPLEQWPSYRALRGEKVNLDNIEVHHPERIIPLQAWATPITDQAGEINYAIVAFQDISERKKAEEERQKFIEEMFEVNCNLELALQDEELLNDVASRFVPNQFLSFLGYESLAEVKTGDAVQKEMSVLFSDIRNFTLMSERMNPEDNFKFINGYLSRMEPAITENYGFIDKYIGDEIMALFGGCADDAVRAAISMLQRLGEYNLTRQRPDRRPINIGIGINTGDMMLGIVGGQHRIDSTVISDTVNLASRLENLTKLYSVSLLISEKTFLKLADPNFYSFRIIDKVTVKGKSDQVSVFEIFDADPLEIKISKLKNKTLFESALTWYHLHDFEAARAEFELYLSHNPTDHVAQIYFQKTLKRSVDP